MGLKSGRFQVSIVIFVNKRLGSNIYYSLLVGTLKFLIR